MAEKSKKSKKSKKDNKNLIIGCCAAFVLLVAIIITIVVVVNNNSLNDNYFVSDGSKYVLTIEADETDEEDQYAPLKTHQVFTYEGDKITGMKTYYVYADNDSAKAAFDALKEAIGDQEAALIEQNGKYVIITAEEESYKDLTTSDVKQQIELWESLKNMNYDDTDDAEEGTETVDVEDEVEDQE